MMTRSLHLLWLPCLLLGACSTPEVLQLRDGTVPTGTDLSGRWILREIDPSDRRRMAQAMGDSDRVSTADLYRSSREAQSRVRSKRPRNSGLVYVFLETGKALKITQTPHALFISFDRSVVEEFRFGEMRMISIGEIEAQRVTGWEGRQLVVETLDKDGMKLTERFDLADGGKTLHRQITFRTKKLEEETIVQVFDKGD